MYKYWPFHTSPRQAEAPTSVWYSVGNTNTGSLEVSVPSAQDVCMWFISRLCPPRRGNGKVHVPGRGLFMPFFFLFVYKYTYGPHLRTPVWFNYCGKGWAFNYCASKLWSLAHFYSVNSRERRETPTHSLTSTHLLTHTHTHTELSVSISFLFIWHSAYLSPWCSSDWQVACWPSVDFAVVSASRRGFSSVSRSTPPLHPPPPPAPPPSAPLWCRCLAQEESPWQRGIRPG